eukprot:CAMPEP_0175711886 /NCGR_PEP_ID=MMETSP0097-20121207/40816_1 /TAXON_ID=311494 /ORGANISM="Alexandrium monilatum, Strain CCMP3105" /LENGTH=63 /DNA_ID=CAMNT_0017019325 /DNA_START=11 /DNA_END=198 /DNA_ORIENTATION=-
MGSQYNSGERGHAMPITKQARQTWPGAASNAHTLPCALWHVSSSICRPCMKQSGQCPWQALPS